MVAQVNTIISRFWSEAEEEGYRQASKIGINRVLNPIVR